MKRLLILLSVLMPGCTGCSHIGLHATPQGPSITPVIHLVGRFASAQACVVGERTALSAAHVSDLRPFDSEMPLYPYGWSDEAGHAGVIFPTGVSRISDLTRFCNRTGTFSFIAKRAANPPKPGDSVRVVGYDWRSEQAAYATRVWDLKVSRVVAGSIVMSTGAERGSSGSCVLNQDGEAVGIMSHLTPVEGNGDPYVSVAAGIWGDLPEELGECPEIK